MIISNNVLEDIIRKEYLKDKQAQRALAKSTEDFKKTSTDLLLLKGLIYMPENQQNNIIKIYYNNLL